MQRISIRFAGFAATAAMLTAPMARARSLDPSGAPAPTMVTLQELSDKQDATQQLVAAMAAPRTLSAAMTAVAEGYYEATDLGTVYAELAANNLLSGVTVFGIQGAIANRGDGPTVTPTTSVQTVTSGYYGSDITVAGDTNLIAENIAEGVQIFGVTGSLAGGAGLLKTGQS